MGIDEESKDSKLEKVEMARKEINDRISKARIAQKICEGYSQERVNDLIKAMVWSICQKGIAEKIAQNAVDESMLGNYEGKFAKISGKTRAALMDILPDKSMGVIEEDKERCLIKIAKPVGVIGALSPSTNPEATPVIKAINAVKARNAIIIAPHPRAKKVNSFIINCMRAALEKMDAPADLVQAIEVPSLDKANILMQSCDLVLATGGSAMVKSAYSSGRPAIGVGTGNAVITVDETADIEDAAKKIKLSKTFDFAASCSSDNSVIAVESIYNKLVNALEAQGGYLVKEGDYEKIAQYLWINGNLNPEAVVKDPHFICDKAGVKMPKEKNFVLVPETDVGPKHPFSGEKLSPILALWKVKDLDEAISLTNRIQKYQGFGHSCGIYSQSDDNVLKFGSDTYTSRVMVNQPQAASNSGNLWNGMRQTFSLGCGTWGGNSTNDNINWKHLVNVTWISKPLPISKTIPSDEELFGDIIQKVGTPFS